MLKGLKIGLWVGCSAALVGATVGGIVVSATRPDFDLKSIEVSKGDLAVSGVVTTASKEPTAFAAEAKGNSVHGGKTPTNFDWSILVINHSDTPSWLHIHSSGDDVGKIYWDKTTAENVGMYEILVQVSLWGTTYHSLTVCELTMSAL